MNRAKTTITIRDVAQAAGLSVSTVSRVLNNKADVSPQTSRKVRQVIEELGYTSSLAARSMRSRRTNVIGLVLTNVGDPFSVQVMRGINQAIVEFGYDLIVYTGGGHQEQSPAEQEQRYVSLLDSSITDGMIVVTPTATTFSTASPLVVVDPNKENPDYPAVIADNRIGALQAMEYLIGLGHRRIGFINGRPDLQSANQRRQGYQDGLRQANLTFDPELVQVGDYSVGTGFTSAQKLLQLSNPPTAIFAANDQSAFGVFRAAQEVGLSIPDDLSVVGFDNTPEAAYINPTLTTVDQSVDKLGYAATEMLIRLIEGKSVAGNLYKMPTQLIVRASCRAIAGRVDRETG